MSKSKLTNKTEKIIKIELGKIYHLLSGRSRAKEAIENANLSPDCQLCVSFAGVESVAQSFVSELLISIHRCNVDLLSVEFVDFDSDHVRQRLDTELERMKKILNL